MADGRLRQARGRLLRGAVRVALAGLLLLVLAPAAARAQQGLSPLYPEDRVEIDTYEYPWSAIGRVSATGRGIQFCTGTLVSERVVVTAAHCLWNRTTGRWYPPEYIHFVAGYQREVRLAHSVARRLLIAPGYEYDRQGEQDYAHDWALLELEEPLGRKVGYVGWARLDPASWQRVGGQRAVFQSVGYRSDRHEVQTVDRDCRLAGFRGSHLVAHHCPIVQGDSGGPLLRRDGDRVYLMGINVAMSIDFSARTSRNLMVPSANFWRELGDFGVAGSTLRESPSIFGSRGRRPELPLARPAREPERRRQEPRPTVPFPGS